MEVPVRHRRISIIAEVVTNTPRHGHHISTVPILIIHVRVPLKLTAHPLRSMLVVWRKFDTED